MKVKIYSQSGKPTNVEHAQAFESEFKKCYDELWESKQAGKITIDEMKLKLDEVDKELRAKYTMFMEVDLPTSGKQWKKLIMDFGVPVTVAITEQDYKLAIFLMDSQYA